MKRNILLHVLACMLLFAGLTSFSPDSPSTLVRDIFKQTNQFRKSQGLPALIMREELNAIAQQHSEDMASGKVAFGHEGFAERNTMASAAIKQIHSVAENVAYGATTAVMVVTMWKSSPGHRRNMLGPYKYVGIGTAKDNAGQIYYTEFFAW